MIPREANETEKSELAFYVAEQMGGFEYNDNMEQAKGHIEGAAIAVFDNYITDSPGYAGKLMTVVWPGSPDMYEVFIWSLGKMKHLNQDKGFSIEEPEPQPF